MRVSLVLNVLRMDFDDRAADVAGLRVPELRKSSHLKHLFECCITLFQRLFASSSDLDLVVCEFLADGDQRDL